MSENYKLKVYFDGESCPEILQRAADETYALLKQKVRLYVDYSIVSEEEIQEINKNNRGVDAVTDVLSFPMLDNVRNTIIRKKDFPFDYDEDEKAIFLGSLCICDKRMKEQAKEYGHSEERELTYLFVHALMHLFGYDHMTEDDKKEMREKEELVLNKIGVTR